MSPSGSVFNDSQRHLLRASLLDGDAARSAFERWLTSRVDPLDPGSRRLLPLLQLNLRRLGDDFAERDWIREQVAAFDRRNQALIEATVSAISALERAAVATLLLKGVPLATHYYPAIAARPMDDCDLLVPADAVARALDVLGSEGWRCEIPLTPATMRRVHAGRFARGNGLFIDLHWHITPETCGHEPDARSWWDDSRTLELHGTHTRMLSPADMLFHVCVHGQRWSTTPTLRWVPDALFILRKEDAAIDWDRVVARAEKHELALPLLEALLFLREELDAPIPQRVIEELTRLPISRASRVEHRVKQQPRNRRRLLFIHWFQHRRISNGTLAGDLAGFPRYLRDIWALRGRG